MVEKNQKKILFLFSLTTILVILLDQLTKYFISWLNLQKKIFFLTINLVKNTGAGFGILPKWTFWLTLLSLVVAMGTIYYYPKIPPEKLPQILFALFLGGVVGNLIDRLLRGYVIDFLSVPFWPAFNIADSAITLSTLGLVIYYWKK